MGWIEEKRILLNLCCGVLQLTRLMPSCFRSHLMPHLIHFNSQLFKTAHLAFFQIKSILKRIFGATC